MLVCLSSFCPIGALNLGSVDPKTGFLDREDPVKCVKTLACFGDWVATVCVYSCLYVFSIMYIFYIQNRLLY